MHKLLILGSGKIGTLITCLLSTSGDYDIHLCDINTEHIDQYTFGNALAHLTVNKLDASDSKQLDHYLNKHKFDAVISGLPYFCNQVVVDAALKHKLHYFDLTEDIAVTRHVIQCAHKQQQSFVPQCGLAPGFISIISHDLMQRFDSIETVKMRVGALPVNQNNTLKYSLTWSTDGLINEYGNTCYGIENGQYKELFPLEGYETISIDALQYEAFNTSGGLGTLADSYKGKVNTLNYKTLRYPGHCEMIKLLMIDLKLNHDRSTLKRILENAVPKTLHDVVIIYVSVTGQRECNFFEDNYVQKVYPRKINGRLWSAIQITTAAGICAVVDIVLNNPAQYQGLVKQEDIAFQDFINNRFGRYYNSTKSQEPS